VSARSTVSLGRGLAWGAAGFVVAALGLKPLAIAAFGLPAGGWAFVAAAALSVGVIEEGTRAAVLGRSAAAGRGLAGVALGWALAEGLIVGLGGLVQLTVLAGDPAALAAARAGLPPGAGEALQRQVDGLSPLTLLAWPLERGAAIALQIGFTAALAAGLARGTVAGRAGAVTAVALAHAAVDVPAAGFQAGLWPLGPVQALYAVIALALAPWALRWCRAQLTPSAPAATSG